MVFVRKSPVISKRLYENRQGNHTIQGVATRYVYVFFKGCWCYLLFSVYLRHVKQENIPMDDIVPSIHRWIVRPHLLRKRKVRQRKSKSLFLRDFSWTTSSRAIKRKNNSFSFQWRQKQRSWRKLQSLFSEQPRQRNVRMSQERPQF